MSKQERTVIEDVCGCDGVLIEANDGSALMRLRGRPHHIGSFVIALSARCYHARAHGRSKDTCDFVCNTDSDGMVLRTLDDNPFLAENGIQTMSYAYVNLIGDILDLRAMGVSRSRLSPQTYEMIAVTRTFHAPFCDGFYAGDAGQTWSRAALQ